jgi:hypothetical protein
MSVFGTRTTRLKGWRLCVRVGAGPGGLLETEGRATAQYQGSLGWPLARKNGAAMCILRGYVFGVWW